MTKLIIAFRNFANAPKKHEIYIYNAQESQRVTLIFISDRRKVRSMRATPNMCVKVQEMSLFQETFKDI